MKTALLDVNVLTALHWPAHEHHEAAHRWLAERSTTRWATCPLTQLGFLRIVSNPSFSRDALSPAEAITLLDTSRMHSRHEFWSDDIDVRDALSGFEGRLQGHKQVTDAYLLILATRHKGVLATFDRRLAAIAGRTFDSALDIVPTR